VTSISRGLCSRTARVVATAAALTIVGTFAAGSASAAPTRSLAADSSASNEAILSAQVNAYLASYPSMSLEAARAAAVGQDVRKSVVIAALEDSATFGGAWFDAPSGVLHVAVTSQSAADEVSDDAARSAVKVQTHLVERSFATLEKIAAGLRAETTALGRVADQQVGISVETNEVVAAVPAGQRSALAAAAPAGVRVDADPQLPDFADAACTSRTNCDWTVRAGTVLWRGSQGSNVCSVGFTARNSYSRYVYTAGHCSNGNGVTWGTAGQYIGPMHASKDTGAYDAAIIRVTNPWFTGDSGGQIYMENTNHFVDVDYEAPTLGYMVPGETVCLSANITAPNGPNLCGTFGTTSDPYKRGLARVNGLDGCHRDSGGGWYWLGSGGYRVAYGLHSRSSYDGCHVSGGSSWFSALPVIKSGWVPSLNVELR
jgi:streptogrisin C